MNLTPHFTLEELTASETAERNGWDNSPNDAELANLTRLADFLEPLLGLLVAVVAVRVVFLDQHLIARLERGFGHRMREVQFGKCLFHRCQRPGRWCLNLAVQNIERVMEPGAEPVAPAAHAP